MSSRPAVGSPKVAVVAEFYPSEGDPVLGVWAHRQALAARDAGAEVRVLVLHRLIPPRASFASGPSGAASALAKLVREPRKQTHDGLQVSYVPYVSPPRPGSYASWGAWATPALLLALRRLRRSFEFDLIHAHNAVPAGDAVRRALAGLRSVEVPLVISVHGGDVLYTAAEPPTGTAAGAAAVARGLRRRTSGARQQSRNRRARARPRRRRDARGAPWRRPAQYPAFFTTHGIAGAGGDRKKGRRPGGRPEPGDGRAPGRPQAPRRRPARTGGALPATSDAALRDHRRRARAGRARGACRPSGNLRPGRASTGSCHPRRRSSRRGVARCS